MNEDIKIHQFAAENIRQAFDKEFGKGVFADSIEYINELLKQV